MTHKLPFPQIPFIQGTDGLYEIPAARHEIIVIKDLEPDWERYDKWKAMIASPRCRNRSKGH